MGVFLLLVFKVPDIEHMGQHPHIVDNLIELVDRQSLQPVDDFLLNGRRSIPGQDFTGFRQFNGDDPSVR